MKINKRYKIKPIRNPYPVSRKNRIRFFSHSFDLEAHELLPETYKVDIDLLQEAGDLNFYLNYIDNDFPNKVHKYVYDVNVQNNNVHNITIESDYGKEGKHYLLVHIKSEQFKFIDYIDIRLTNKSRQLGDWFKPHKQPGVDKQWKLEECGWILNDDILVSSDNIYTLKIELDRQIFTDTFKRMFDISILVETNEPDYYNDGWDAELLAKVNSLIELKLVQKEVPYYFRIAKFNAIGNGKPLIQEADNTYVLSGYDPLSYNLTLCSNADLVLKTYIMNGNKKEEFKWSDNANEYIRFIKMFIGTDPTDINDENQWKNFVETDIIPKNIEKNYCNYMMLALKPFYDGKGLTRTLLFEFYDKNANNKLVYYFKFNQSSFVLDFDSNLMEIIGNLRISPFKDEQKQFNEYIRENNKISADELERYYKAKTAVLCCDIKISDSGYIQLLPKTTKGVKKKKKD